MGVELVQYVDTLGVLLVTLGGGIATILLPGRDHRSHCQYSNCLQVGYNMVLASSLVFAHELERIHSPSLFLGRLYFLVLDTPSFVIEGSCLGLVPLAAAGDHASIAAVTCVGIEHE